MSANQIRWHLVFSKACGEQIAKTNMERQGYRVYFPRAKAKVVSRGRLQEKICALFPRYLFVQLNSAIQSLAPIRSTTGVAGVVRFGTEYVAVPATIIDGLIDREDALGLHQLPSEPAFVRGSVIRVMEGTLTGFDGIFERTDGEGRVVLLLNLLGRETRVNLPIASVASLH